MLSEEDKLILTKLQNDYPEAYDMFLRYENEHRNIVKAGCHNLRNIVTLISGGYQLLALTQPKLTEMKRWKQMGADISDLVKAFNDVAAYRYASSINPSPTTTDALSDILRDYIRTASPLLEQRICITVDTSADINIDSDRLCCAIVGLINNAVEASDMAEHRTDSVHVNIFCKSEDDRSLLSVTVTNTGNPPNPDIVPVMFRPFTSDKSGHMGLGLAIAAETAGAIDGQVSWSCEDGLTNFTLTVPC